MTGHWQFLVLMAGFSLVAGCNTPAAYFDGLQTLEIRSTDVDPDAAHPVVGNWVQSEYWLDFAPPEPDELEDLQPDGEEPAQQRPWIRRDSLEVSVVWRLINTTEDSLRAFVLLDGATEFYDWDPIPMYGIGGGEDADEIPFPSLLGFSPLELEGEESRSGEFREDDLGEAIYDLDVLTRFCGGPLAVLYNRSEVDPVGTGAVPDDAVIAGPVMLRVTLGADAPATLEYSIRVRDRDGILYDDFRDDDRYETDPVPYVPAGVSQTAAGQMDPGVMTEYCGTTDDG